ncbi:uncharacterized protein [Dermacentor albipictus]|uniref:uncharacterized protein isoform X2 n=1 Tax=Dermacentor albipictus TaxID=60249 RepID=UPI0031FBF95B
MGDETENEVASTAGTEIKRSDEGDDTGKKVFLLCCAVCLLALFIGLLLWTSHLNQEEDIDANATYKPPKHKGPEGSGAATSAQDLGTTATLTTKIYVTVQPHRSEQDSTQSVTTKSSGMNTAATILATSSSPEPASSTATPTKAIATTPSKAIATTPTVTTTPATTASTLPLCTVDCNIRMEVPPDGVCDFIFFDSLYVTCGGGVGGAQTTPKLQRFFDLATQGNHTQFGCSIDALHLAEFVDDIGKSDSLKWAQEKLWANNVYHWGVMNVYHVLVFQHPDIVKKALEALKAVAHFSQPSSVKRVASYTFLGVYVLPYLKPCENIGLHTKSVFSPDMIVVLGHLSYQENKFKGFAYYCYVLAPNLLTLDQHIVYSRNKTAWYSHTLGDAAVLATCLRQERDIKSPLAISFTLKGRMYQPKVKEAIDETLFKKCIPGNFSQYVDPLEFCDLAKKGYISGPFFVNIDKTNIAFVTTPERTTVVYFDSKDTLRLKICVLKYQAVDLAVSLAPYDVNYDFDSFDCNAVSNFSRTVHIATTVLDFIKNRFTDGSRKSSCIALGKGFLGA